MVKIKLLYLLLLLSFSALGQEMNPEMLEELLKKEIVKENVEENSPLVDSSVRNEDCNNPDIYGHNFFCSSPTSISPIGDLPVPNDYLISLRDELEITYLGDPKNRSFIRPVRLDGSIMIPEIGLINVEGQTLSEVRERIKTKVSETYIGIKAQVTLKELSAKKILIVGSVNKPGAYLVNPFTTVSNALSYAGGLKEYASIRDIEVINTKGKSHSFDAYDLLIYGSRKNDISLNSGDTILVKNTNNLISIVGSVQRPMIYEYKELEKPIDLIDFALGFKKTAKKNLVLVEEINEDNSKYNFSYKNFQEIKDLSSLASITIFNGGSFDVSNQPKGGLIASTRSGSQMINVLIEGEVMNPGFYKVVPGTRVNDIYSLSGGLTEQADRELTVLTRESVRQKQLENLDKAQKELLNSFISKAIETGTEVNESLIEYTTLNIEEENIGRISGNFSKNSKSAQSTFLQEGDTVFIPQESKTISILGEVRSPVTILYRDNFDLDEYIQFAGGYKKSAEKRGTYLIKANGEVLLYKKNTGWLPSKGLEIEAGDTIVIPRKIKRTDYLASISGITSIISNIAFAAASLDSLRN